MTGLSEANIRLALDITARVSMAFFVAAFAGTALARVWQHPFSRWLSINRDRFLLLLAFSHSLHLAAIIALVLFGSGVLNARFGEKGLLAAVAIAGFADTHSAAVSAASLVAAGKLPLHASAVPILVALSTNTISKIVVAVSSGGWRFARSVVPGLVLVIASAWGAFALM